MVLHVPSALSQYVVVVVGDTTGEAPDIAYVPPQETVYHFHIAPSVLRLPPVMFKVADVVVQMVKALEPAETAGVDKVFTVMVLLTQVVVLHVPSALSQ